MPPDERRQPSETGFVDRPALMPPRATERLFGEHGLLTSMSCTGNCWDNACVENFFGTLKRELVSHRHDATREDAKHDLFEYMECSLIEGAVTRPSAMTPLPSTKRGRR